MATNGVNGSLPSKMKAAQFNPKTGKAEINEVPVISSSNHQCRWHALTWGSM